MVDFGPRSQNWAKFLNAINLEPYELAMTMKFSGFACCISIYDRSKF